LASELTWYDVSHFLPLWLCEECSLCVCTGQEDNVLEFKYQITATVAPEILSCVWDEIKYRLATAMSLGSPCGNVLTKTLDISLISMFNVIQYLYWLINCSLIKSWSH
jgi:hypothetical protein